MNGRTAILGLFFSLSLTTAVRADEPAKPASASSQSAKPAPARGQLPRGRSAVGRGDAARSADKRDASGSAKAPAPPASPKPPPAPASPSRAPSPCSMEKNQDGSCDALFRLGTLAVLAADAQSVPGLKLARRVCDRYAVSYADAERSLAARAGGYQESGPGAAFRRPQAARLPEPLTLMRAFCDALSRPASPNDEVPFSLRASVVVTPRGRVSYADALKHARMVSGVSGPRRCSSGGEPARKGKPSGALRTRGIAAPGAPVHDLPPCSEVTQ